MTHTRSWLVTAGLAGLALVAGCSSSGSGSGGNVQAQQAGGATTVALRSASGGKVLVDAKGRTLYSSDQEKAAGKILCSSSDCVAIWTPLTVAKGQHPTGPTSVMGELSTMRRPDGSIQVAFMGAPLYTFSFDHSAGDVTGNGKMDSFGGTSFTWHAASANGAAPAPASAATSAATNPGYGY